jgi:tRNA-splicing ligase RtcB (3'-phosphate/5'-hydroxy nucleic acid ligase)
MSLEYTGKYGTAIVYNDEVESTAVASIINLLNQEVSQDAHVRIMPDVHAGKGCVIGYTAKLTNKVIPNLIGVDIGCFFGETKVALTDGRHVSFLDLVKEHQEGKTNYCFSLDEQSNVVISKIENPHQTRVVDSLIKITLDNGEEIECTEDHVFYTRDNREVRAKDLIVGQSLMPLYLKKSQDVPLEKKSYRNKKNKLADYTVVFNPNTGFYDFVHFLADDYNRGNGVYSTKGIRHHKDFNKINNNPDNIEICSWKEHWQKHMNNALESIKSGRTGFGRARQLHPEFFAQMGSDNMKKNFQDPAFKKRAEERGRKAWIEFNKTEQFKEMTRLAGQRGKKYLIEFNKNPKLCTCEVCGRVVKGRGAFVRHQSVHTNHTIISIERIEKKSTPVYCLTVEKHHNFALSAGVFVHNCGMLSFKIGHFSKLGENRDKLDKFIRANIPSGHDVREKPFGEMHILFDDKIATVVMNYHSFEKTVKDICKVQGQSFDRVMASIGTLGGGNHFIELGKDEEGFLWLTFHSGSRNFGKMVAEYHQEVAEKQLLGPDEDEFKRQVEIIKTTKKGKGIQEAIQALRKGMSKRGKASGLEYLTGDKKDDYIHDMMIAQMYARLNRMIMAYDIIANFYKLNFFEVEMIESVHNYINFQDGIIRKGAISAHYGEKVIIPFNMRDGLIIGVGKGNEEWNNSAPHGSGRLMSRAQAKGLDLDYFEKTMKDAGVWSSCIGKGTLDESPMAYKNTDTIISYLEPTVEIKNRVLPIYNFKAGEESRERED